MHGLKKPTCVLLLLRHRAATRDTMIHGQSFHEHGTREFTCVREKMSAPRAPRLAPWPMETRQHTDSTTADRRAPPRVGARAGDDQHRGAAAFTQILVTWQRGEDVIVARGRKLVPWHCDLARAM